MYDLIVCTLVCSVYYVALHWKGHVASATALSFRSRRRCCCAICPRYQCVFTVHICAHIAWLFFKTVVHCCVVSGYKSQYTVSLARIEVTIQRGYKSQYSEERYSARNFRSRLSWTNSHRGGEAKITIKDHQSTSSDIRKIGSSRFLRRCNICNWFVIL